MSSPELQRKLTAILFADVVGYSRLTGEDEAGTHHRLTAYLDIFTDIIDSYGGRVVNFAGDAILADFPSVTNSLVCAACVQQELAKCNAELEDHQKVQFRIGINLGDVIVNRDDIYGDGVNVAARLEGLAKPAAICVSESVYTAIGSKLPIDFEYLGEQHVKNIANPVKAYYALQKPGTNLPEPVAGPSAMASTKSRFPIALAISAIVVATAAGGIAWWDNVRPAPAKNIASSLANKTSIAVLPFTNTSGGLEQEYFVNGMTDDLITDLSKISGLFVIARNSVFNYSGNTANINEVAEDLGVRYVLSGSIRRAGNQVRINSQLIDSITGGEVWAERYDGESKDVFNLQDEITASILSALQVQLTDRELKIAGHRYTKHLDAYDSLLKGLNAAGHRSRQNNIEAKSYFEQAIDIDPGFARAYSELANLYRLEYELAWSAEPESSLAMAYDLAAKAIELDESLPQSHFVMAQVYRARKEFKLAIASIERTIELDPNHANAFVALAGILCYGGRATPGLDLIKQAKQLNPYHTSDYLLREGQCNFVKSNYTEAIKVLEEGAERVAESQRMRAWLAASYQLAGRQEDAEWEAEVIQLLNPDFTVSELSNGEPFKDKKHLDKFLGALRSIGLP